MTRRRSMRVLVRLWDHGKLLVDVVQTPILLSVALAGNLILLVCAFMFYSFERESNPAVTTFFDAIGWSFSTVTTVGFGDITPVTTAGRVVGIALMIGGVTSFVSFTALLVAIVTARAASDILGIEAREARDLRRIAHALEDIQERLGHLERRGGVGPILAQDPTSTQSAPTHATQEVPRDQDS